MTYALHCTRSLGKLFLYAATLFAASGHGAERDKSNDPLPGALETMSISIAGIGRTAIVYTPLKLADKGGIGVATIVALRNDAGSDTVNAYLRNSGLLDIAEQSNVLVVLPSPRANGWDVEDSADVDFVAEEVGNFTANYSKAKWKNPIDPTSAPIATSETLRYLMADGNATAVAHAVAMKRPEKVTALLTSGGAVPPASFFASEKIAVPVWVVNATKATIDFWKQANGVASKPISDERFGSDTMVYRNPDASAQQVIVSSAGAADKLEATLVKTVWSQFFDKTRRFDYTTIGVPTIKPTLAEAGLIQVENVTLDDGNNIAHGWLEGRPEPLVPGKKYPLVISASGSSQTPLYHAEQTHWHELGKREGFFTVYPWSNDRLNWFEEPDRAIYNDVKYMVALVKHLSAKYPIDESRIYFTGFSAGSLMARTMGALYPELVAAVAPFNANTCPGCPRPGMPGNTLVPDAVAAKKAAGLARGVDYRMPVFMVYGTRDREFKLPTKPLLADGVQRKLINFWLDYNNVAKYPYQASEGDLLGVGTQGGATVVRSGIDASYPQGRFTTYQFADHGEKSTSLVNYTLVQDMPHAVDPRQVPLAWEFMKRFKRNADGTLGDGRTPKP